MTTSTTDEAKDDFCTQNPKAPQCIVGSFGGSCSSGFSCDGDAIQCAIAKEVKTRNCQLFETTSPESEAYDQAKVKTGNQTVDLPGNETVNITPGSITGSNIIGGTAVGMADLTVEVMNHPVTLPFSQINPILEYLGFLLMAIGGLLSYRIVTRG